MWNLNVSQRVKTFTWLLCHGKIKTYVFLLAMNLGHLNICVFCDIHVETVEHLFNDCVKFSRFHLKLWNSQDVVFMALFRSHLDLGSIIPITVFPGSWLRLLLQLVGISRRVGVIVFSTMYFPILLNLLGL